MSLRQIKHFVEISLPKVDAVLPESAQVQGVNVEGKAQAIDVTGQLFNGFLISNGKRVLWSKVKLI